MILPNFKLIALALAANLAPIATGLVQIFLGNVLAGIGAIAGGVGAATVQVVNAEAEMAQSKEFRSVGLVRWFFRQPFVLMTLALGILLSLILNPFNAMTLTVILLVAFAAAVGVAIWVSYRDSKPDDTLPSDFFDDEKGAHLTKKALLIGINTYARAPLKGCVNDVNDAKKALTAKGFRVRVLTNSKATDRNIKAGYAWLTADTQPGDKRLFWYSGHGTQLDDPREADGYSEALCPINLSWDDLGTFVTDDNLYSRYNTLSNGANLTFVLDCCHAWDDDRDFKKDTLSRFLAPPESHAHHTRAVSTIAGRSNLHDSVLVIAGCRADQTSMDAVFIEPTGKKRFNGALSRNLIDTLIAMPDTTAIETVMEEVQRRVAAQGYEQVPGLHGSERLKKLPFLG